MRIYKNFAKNFSIKGIKMNFTKTTPYCKVLVLHRTEDKEHLIGGISEPWLKESIKIFKNKGYNFITLEQFLEYFAKKSFPKKSILITIDDGFEDQVEKITPIFLEQGIKPTIFLITSFIEGKETPWDEKIRALMKTANTAFVRFKHLNGYLGYYLRTPKEIKYAQHDFINRCELLPKDLCDQSINQLASALNIEMPMALQPESVPANINSILKYASKGVSFANHTATHSALGSNTASFAKTDIEDAQSFLSKYKLETKTFAYPIGKQRSIGNSIQEVSDSGFQIAFTAIEGIADSNDNPFTIPRIPYPQSVNQLKELCSPVASYRFSRANVLIGLHDIIKMKFLINRYGGKAASLTLLKHQLKLLKGDYQSYLDINFSDVRRVVFFCQGNINRSAIAQAYFKLNSSLECASFGLDTQDQYPPSVSTLRWAKKYKLDLLNHKTKKVEDFKFLPGDLLIAFEPEQIMRLRNKKIQLPEQIQFTLAGLWTLSHRPYSYIHDPVARPEIYFDRCFKIIQSAAESLASKLP
jgi:peptidoglycan/xylan/chitin deacetylase (PgdA/CDA1 family)/protein-tyrosine-phosphatase